MNTSERNELLISVLPLIKSIVKAYCEEHGCLSSLDDLVGDCNLKALEWVEKYNPERGALTMYIGECAKIWCRKQWKKHAPFLPLNSSIGRIESTEPNPLDLAENNEDMERMREALAELPEHERVIIEFRYFQNLTLKECGKRLGYTAEAARQAEGKALAHLRQAMEDNK